VITNIFDEAGDIPRWIYDDGGSVYAACWFAAAWLAAEGDDLAADGVGLHHAPAGRLQGGVDQFGAGFGLVHDLERAYSAA
jgi:hypothetical protein